MPTPQPRIFLTAAELSGDRHAAKLAKALAKLRPGIGLEGIGGEAMRGAGVTVHHETVRKARMGLGSFLRVREIAGVLRETRRRFRKDGPPDLMICCDSWTMNKHFLKLARAFGVPTMYYVSPQVWASREGRIRQMRRLIDRMAVILPFEEQWLRERGLDATFVGHPLFDELPESLEPSGPRFPDRPPVVALIPGSRRKVAADNFPGLIEVGARLWTEFPEVKFVIPVVDATAEVVRDALEDKRPGWVPMGRAEVADGRFDEMVRRADAAICVSGTATLHAAALGVPLVAVYKGNRLLWATVGRALLRTSTFALVNWLHPERKHVVPEFIPWFGDPQPVADQVLEWLRNPGKLAAQREAQNAVVEPLRTRGASESAARMALEMLDIAAAPRQA